MTSPSATHRHGSVMVFLGLSEVLAQAACGTTYQPRRTQRVGVVIHHAAAMYVSDGHEVPIGPFNGALEELVEKTPAAAAHAHKAHTEFVIGIPTYLTGAAGVILAVAALSGPIGWVVIGIGASAVATGLGLMGAAVTHAVDAVNIHNDNVSEIPVGR